VNLVCLLRGGESAYLRGAGHNAALCAQRKCLALPRLSAVETKAAFDKARAMIEQAEALGEHVEDPLLLYSVLNGFFIAKFIPFEGVSACALASQFLELARQRKAAVLIMIGHRLLGTTLLCLGEPAEALKHLSALRACHASFAHHTLWS